MSCVLLATVSLLAGGEHVLGLTVPDLDATFYGSVYWGNGVLTSVEHEVVVSAYAGTNLVATCRLGERQADRYILRVPMARGDGLADRARPGDTLHFAVNGIFLPALDTLLTAERGADVELDLHVNLVQLAVSGDRGAGTPTGTDAHGVGTVLTLECPHEMIGEAGVRYRLAGFTGAGSVPAQGDAAAFEVTLTEDSALAWQWETAYRLETLAEPPYGGTITVHPAPDADGFFAPGQEVQVTAVPHPGFIFREWAVDTQGRNESVNMLMQGPCAAVALFDPDANEDGLPDEWQVIHFGSYLADRAAPDADPSGSNMTNLEKWIAGLDPNDPDSVFRIGKLQAAAAGGISISWHGVNERSYRLFMAETLSGPWVRYPDNATEFTGHDADITVPITSASPTLFFRLEVRR